MTVETTTTVAGPYPTNGIATAFPFNFKALSANEVEVVLVVGSAESVVSSSLYRVTLADQSGTVIFTAAPASGANLYVRAAPDFTQNIAFSNQSAFLPNSHNEANDRSALRAQVLAEGLSRTPALPIEAMTVAGMFPKVQADGTWGYDAAGPGATGPANSTYTTLAGLKAAAVSNASYIFAPPSGSDGGAAAGTFLYQTAGAPYTADGVNVIKLDAVPLTTGALVRQTAASVAYDRRSVARKLQEFVSVYDTKYAGGAKGDGVTDDTAAWNAAAIDAVALGRQLYAPGTFALANAKLPGQARYLCIVGDPVFIQGQPDTPVLTVETSTLQQTDGYRFACTVIPHPASSKSNPANIAINLTGFSTAEIKVTLGTSSSYTDTTGRFHTVVYADAAVPFHYGNRLSVIATAVPAPRRLLRYGNRGSGVIANPNINSIYAYVNALDTKAGDIILDLGDSTACVVDPATLIEGCPNAIGVKLGNATTVRCVWPENVGVAFDLTGTPDTTPNNCSIERVYFSGGGTVRIANDLGAPPLFEGPINDGNATFLDQGGSPSPRSLWTRGYPQPAAPAVSFTVGGAPLSPQENSIRHRVDHHGRTTSHITYTSTPTATGPATLRIAPPTGWEIEQAEVGVRNSSDQPLAVALGDDVQGRDRKWVWANTTMHTINIRVTMRATA